MCWRRDSFLKWTEPRLWDELLSGPSYLIQGFRLSILLLLCQEPSPEYDLLTMLRPISGTAMKSIRISGFRAWLPWGFEAGGFGMRTRRVPLQYPTCGWLSKLGCLDQLTGP